MDLGRALQSFCNYEGGKSCGYTVNFGDERLGDGRRKFLIVMELMGEVVLKNARLTCEFRCR